MAPKKNFYLLRPGRFVNRLRARITKPNTDPAKINQILSEYDLKLLGKPHVPLNSGRSKSIIIDTDQGKKILKRYEETVSDSMIEYEHSIVKFLKGIGFPVPGILTSNNGTTITNQGGARYVIFDFIKGGFHYRDYWVPPSQEKRYIAASGKIFADLHKKLKDFVPEGINPYGFINMERGRERNLEWYLEQLSDNQKQFTGSSGGKSPQAENILHSQTGNIQESLVELENEINQANLPKQIIHGDYGPYNILFKDNKIIAVLDFELARLDWRITDLVYALPRFAETRFGFDFNKVNCLIDSYRSIYRIENIELQLIPRIWKYFRLKRCIVCWSRYHDTYQSYWLDLALINFQRAEILTRSEDHFLNQLHFG